LHSCGSECDGLPGPAAYYRKAHDPVCAGSSSRSGRWLRSRGGCAEGHRRLCIPGGVTLLDDWTSAPFDVERLSKIMKKMTQVADGYRDLLQTLDFDRLLAKTGDNAQPSGRTGFQEVVERARALELKKRILRLDAGD
jgi:hypothetical protein